MSESVLEGLHAGDVISSSSNAQVKHVIALQKKRKEREQSGTFVAEGIRLFSEIPADRLEQVYVMESLLAKPDAEAILRLGEVPYDRIPVRVVKDSVFTSMCDTQSPQGVLAVVRRKDWKLEEILSITENPLFIMVENLQDPGNLGTVLRTGEGAGVTALIMSKGTVDIYSPKVTRSTMGSLFRVPFIYVEDMAETIRLLAERNILVYAAHLEGSVPYDEPDYTSGCGLLIGNEGNGLTEVTAQACEKRIRIPMEGQLESLNAAISAGILMYEAKRQRGK